jgi:hypothetical protein
VDLTGLFSQPLRLENRFAKQNVVVYLIIYHSVFLSATLLRVFWSLLLVFWLLLHAFWSLLAYNGALSAALQLLQACFYIAAARELNPQLAFFI